MMLLCAVYKIEIEAMSLWLDILKTRVETGEPYIMFKDNVNKNNPLAYAMNNLDVTMTNICTEITLQYIYNYSHPLKDGFESIEAN